MYLPEDLGQYLCPFTRKVFQLGYANLEQIQQAQFTAERSHSFLPQILEEIIGKPLPVKLVRDYKKYRLFELKIYYGVEAIDLDIKPIDLEIIDDLVRSLIPIEVCRLYRLLPVSQSAKMVTVAMVNPDDYQAFDDLQRRLQPKIIQLRRNVIPQEDYDRLILDYYNYCDERTINEPEKPAQPKPLNIDEELEELLGEYEIGERLENQEELEYNLDENLKKQQQIAPIVRLVNKILIKALQDKVSDIYFEPQETHLLIQFRQGTTLYEPFDPLPKNLNSILVNRFKIMAELDITKRNIKQNGKIKFNYQGQKNRANITVVPTYQGEKINLKFTSSSDDTSNSSKTILQTNTPTVSSVKNRVEEIEKMLGTITLLLQELKKDVEMME